MNLTIMTGVLLAVVTLVMVLLTVFYQKGKGIELAEAAEKESHRKALTSLSKEDYDFLITNGLEVDPEVHRHFYPDEGRQMADWVDEHFVSWIDNEQVGGIRRRKPQIEWNIK